MQRLPVLLAGLCAVSACGGGGDVATVPFTVLALGSTVAGTLAAGDVLAPDATFVDFYLVEVTVAGDLTITMRSADFDSFLILFTNACLGNANLNAWGSCLLAVDDDSGGGVNGLDSLISSFAVTPGSYVIGANSVFPATGAYTLETAFVATDRAPAPLTIRHLTFTEAKATLGKQKK